MVSRVCFIAIPCILFIVFLFLLLRAEKGRIHLFFKLLFSFVSVVGFLGAGLFTLGVFSASMLVYVIPTLVVCMGILVFKELFAVSPLLNDWYKSKLLDLEDEWVESCSGVKADTVQPLASLAHPTIITVLIAQGLEWCKSAGVSREQEDSDMMSYKT